MKPYLQASHLKRMNRFVRRPNGIYYVYIELLNNAMFFNRKANYYQMVVSILS